MADHVLISGLGLMGSSLAACLAQRGWRVSLHHHRAGIAARAAACGYGTAVDDPSEAADADLAVVCTPVSTIAAIARRLAAATRAVITDVGSVKGALCRDLADLGGRFVGSHPMAGSHLQGLDHADARLYAGRLAIITPLPSTPATAVAAIERLWCAAGSRTVRMDPDRHDLLVAEASHLPHLLASAAAAALSPAAAPLAAGGFRDTTRVAGADPRLWADILLGNAAAAADLAAAAATRLHAAAAALRAGDRAAIEAWLAEGRAGRARYEQVAAP